jgi:hypothetical protein
VAKQIDMTRARKQALPVILDAAKKYHEVLTDGMPGRDSGSERRLLEALEAFK